MSSDILKRVTASEGATEFMEPSDAAKLVRRVRRAAFYVSCSVSLWPTEPDESGEGRAYTMPENVQVSASALRRLLEEWQGFSDRKAASGKDPVKVRVHVNAFALNGDKPALKYCVFVG